MIPPAMNTNALMTIHEAARVLGISTAKLGQLVRSDAIPHVRIGDAVRFDEADLWRWIDEKKLETASVAVA